VFWSWRMFLAKAESRYIDMLERALYNGVLAGMSLAGTEYFYENPLEYRRVTARGSAATEDQFADFRMDRGPRKAYHGCSCCPPNVQRLLASLQQYVYAAGNASMWVNLYADSEAKLDVGGGRLVAIRQQTAYPWDRSARLSLAMEDATQFSLGLRIPEWCKRAAVTVNGTPTEGDDVRGYRTITRSWQDGDVVEINLDMPVQYVQSHPRNIANYEKLVVARGPVVYCLEQADNQEVDLFSIVLARSPGFSVSVSQELGGAVVVDGHAFARDDSAWDQAPYRRIAPGTDADASDNGSLRRVRVRAVPYYAWANRGMGSMVTALPHERR